MHSSCLRQWKLIATYHNPARALCTLSKTSPKALSEDVWLCKPGLEKPLIIDLHALASLHGAREFEVTATHGGVVTTKGASEKMYDASAWASQVLPRCTAVSADSVRAIGREATKIAFRQLHNINKETPISRLLVHGLATADSGLLGRCGLVKEHFLTHLKDEYKKTYRLFTPNLDAPSPTTTHEQTTVTNQRKNQPPNQPTNQNQQNNSDHIGVVQVFLVNPSTALVSAAATSLKHREKTGFGWSRPFPWDGGLAGVPTPPESKSPPSRAYQKLDEIFAVIGKRPKRGSAVVDLVSAPGGWTHRLANDLQCNVLSVDRAHLDADLEKHKNVKHVIADGAVWLPNKKVDWLFCDMALPAPKSVEVLGKWVEGKWCKHFAWTIKFVGTADYEAVLGRVRKILENYAYAIRHLPSHGNEVVVVGRTS